MKAKAMQKMMMMIFELAVFLMEGNVIREPILLEEEEFVVVVVVAVVDSSLWLSLLWVG